ncbi:phage terminase large subunit [Christensenellaceae bacterium OttesenSCG-928-L17]|nr:phage terminase large subunit [Christensenellaceae bacterium OttesenSCG-928-L17]
MSMTKKRAKEILDSISEEEFVLEEARLNFWAFCQLMYPSFYLDGREYLTEMCDKLEMFVNSSDKQFLVINCPPRHGKSLTAGCLVSWLFGQNPSYKVMTGSYNETVSGTFARNVRNMIQTKKVGKNIVYSDIFPETSVKYGEAAASMWSLEGNGETSYLATSPTGTATGFGCDYLLIDDIIKSAEEAYNENVLDGHFSWFANTMLSRLEGKRKVIVIMTRWATRDLAGRIVEAYGDAVEIVSYKAANNGQMLCDDILDAKAFKQLSQEMNTDILEANYNQTPIDVKGRLYEPFMEWDVLPEGEVYNITDTADRGKDYLASANYIKHGDDVYITNIVYTDEPMEITESKVANMLADDDVRKAKIESNNGGRGFARNVERILRNEIGNSRVIIETPTQTSNKESRILASSGWIQKHLFMPSHWQKKWPSAAKEVLSYQRKGVNAHDDMCDVLASIYEECTANKTPQIHSDPSRIVARRSAFTKVRAI